MSSALQACLFWHCHCHDEKCPSDGQKSALMKRVLMVRSQCCWKMSFWWLEIKCWWKKSFWHSEIGVVEKCPSGGWKLALLKTVLRSIRTDMQMRQGWSLRRSKPILTGKRLKPVKTGQNWFKPVKTWSKSKTQEHVPRVVKEPC